jgi:hypothetical protein
MWLRHFGQAIVPSVFDFGRNGRAPTHPALLDWLAVEFMDSDWSMKHLHRMLVTSSAYRMTSTPDADNLVKDQDNHWLWRMPSRRLEAEVVRDCLFYVAGKLDPSRGGPDIDHAHGLTMPRRSLYFRHAAEKQMEFLKLFDAASVTECYQRKESVLPQQALALINNEMVIRNGRALTRELLAKVGDDPTAFTIAAFERILARTPTSEELTECLRFLNDQVVRQRDGDPRTRVRENLVHVLFNHNDFVTVR